MRASIAATGQGTMSRCGVGKSANNPLPNPQWAPVGDRGQSVGAACVFHRAQSAPPGCYSTKGSDITTETGGREDGVKDEGWSGSGQCGSHITPLQLLSTCHVSTPRTQQQSPSLGNFKRLLCRKIRGSREIKAKEKKRRSSI